MNLAQAINERRSVRAYKKLPLSKDHKAALERLITTYNAESGLHMQLVTDEPKAFSSLRAHYGKFSNANNYIALIGRKGADLSELCGYFGEQLVLDAQMLGLNSCWVAATYKKVPEALSIDKGEKLLAVIVVGYGAEKGKPHKQKEFNAVSKTIGAMPDWYAKGVEAALLAPTAMNQQKFVFRLLENEKVKATSGFGPCTQIDLGIVKLHFELGSGKDNSVWKN